MSESNDPVVVQFPPKHRRPESPMITDEVRFSKNVAVGFDVLPDGAAVAWREIYGKTYVIPCPDLSTAAVLTLMAYFEVVSSKCLRQFSEAADFQFDEAEEEAAQMFQHWSPHVRFYGENGVPTFNFAMNAEEHRRLLQPEP